MCRGLLIRFLYLSIKYFFEIFFKVIFYIGKNGKVDIDADISHYYELAATSSSIIKHSISKDKRVNTKLTLYLVNYAKLSSNSLVLWNKKSVKGNIQITGGSGHFWFEETKYSQITALLHPLEDGSTHIKVQLIIYICVK